MCEFVSHCSSHDRMSLVPPAAFQLGGGVHPNRGTKVHQHTTIHIPGQLKVANSPMPQIHVLRLWEEAGEPGENPQTQREQAFLQREAPGPPGGCKPRTFLVCAACATGNMFIYFRKHCSHISNMSTWVTVNNGCCAEMHTLNHFSNKLTQMMMMKIWKLSIYDNALQCRKHNDWYNNKLS